MHQKNSHASPTPIIDGGLLYVHFGPHGTACLQLDDGEFVWRTQELVYKPNHGTGGSPALANDMLVICCDGRDVQYVAGLDKRTGDVRWKTPRDTDPTEGVFVQHADHHQRRRAFAGGLSGERGGIRL